MDIKTTGKTGPAERDEKDGGAAGTATTGDLDGAPDGDLADDPDTDPADDPEDDLEDEAAAPAGKETGVGAGAAAVVSAALAAVALTGTWTGKVVSERETLVGQIKTSGSGTPAQQISEIYGDAWHSTALVNGAFALVALIVAVAVLVLPRHPSWVRAVATAGAVLAGLGLLLSIGTYFDLFLSLPTAGS
ncbi:MULTISPECIES: hypothetical protein [Streptomyces]|nr:MULTISPECIES: hypothetical protein [Streptomyces]MBB4158490.1 hypothetical protein [Streptomyces cinereoruber]MBY8814448.1 hypothetical protein [Streptomyces cinereoruber]NIH59151.1 hypothetical protein [Streptomyces cinereoruber]PVC73433.1 hypothetical protein DBP18_13845 [Streptomyces sp. CS081A]QEV34894.1 hypothetical protein CP977_24295 [Streptomyces cinereoruber]